MSLQAPTLHLRDFNMAPLTLLALVLCLTPALYAQDEPTPTPSFERPAFQTLRYNENWSGLAGLDRSQSGDFLDPIKYVPFTEDGNIWASFGGQVRARLEAWNNFNFGAPAGSAFDDDDVFLLTRMRLHGDLHIGEHVRVFVEGKSALSTDRDLVGGRRTLDVDELDLQNGFVDFTMPIADQDRFTARAGRQELLFGKQRLVSPLDWSNTRRTFDGFSGIFEVCDWTATGFWTQLVEVNKYDYNRGDAQTEFFGVYATGKCPATDVGLDLYWLGLDRDDMVAFSGISGKENRHTLGGRLFGKCATSGIDYDLEGAYQLGEVGSVDISAFMVATQLGYAIPDLACTPRIFVGFDYASGGASSSEVNTFNQLFPLSHAWLGYVDVIGRQNIISPYLGVSSKVIDRLTVELTGHAFWRADTGDALYNAGGAVLRAGTLGSDSEIGTEIDLLAKYQLDRHLELQLGYSHFFAGDFIDESGPSKDIDFLYTSMQYTF